MPDDYARFEIEDTSNDLYWNGKRVDLGGWSRTERIGAWSAILVLLGIIVGAIVTVATNYPNVKAGWDALTKQPSETTEQGVVPPQGAAPLASPAR
ncbi:MAG: hypothetical protein U1E66_03465 [Rhodospirillales bacterium]